MTYTNLNLPEATVKLLESKGGIKALAEGDIAARCDSFQALLKVTEAARPLLHRNAGHQFYWIDATTTTHWRQTETVNLPSIPASILVRELEEKPFEWGERVWVSDNGFGWTEGIYLKYAPNNECRKHTAIAVNSVSGMFWKHCQREKPTPAPLRITPEMIKEKFGCQEFEIVNEKG